MTTVKSINHDSSTTIGDFYSTVVDTDGAISVSPTGALNGTTNGVVFDTDAGGTFAELNETFPATGNSFRYRAFFNFSASTITGTPANFISIDLHNGATYIVNIAISGNNIDGGARMESFINDDGGGGDSPADVNVPTNQEFCVEIAMVRETNATSADGTFEWFLDGISQESITDLENFTIFGTGADNVQIDLNTPGLITGDYYYDEFIVDNDSTALLCDTSLAIAPMTKPLDIDASDTFIYVALLEGGTPILSKFAIALDANGTTVFNPGAGDNIGVECGRSNADIIWVAGNFDSTNVVEKSEDAGATFIVKDNATTGDIKSFAIGPDSDSRILVFDETNGDILESVNDGTTWTVVNAIVTPEIAAMARLAINVQETVFGNDAAASNNVDYSVNSGGDLEDFILPVEENVTMVIVN